MAQDVQSRLWRRTSKVLLGLGLGAADPLHTYPVGVRHLEDDLRRCVAEEPAVPTDHERAPLAKWRRVGKGMRWVGTAQRSAHCTHAVFLDAPGRVPPTLDGLVCRIKPSET